MTKQIRKFLDDAGRETSVDDATTCQEMIVDDDGFVIAEKIYRTGPEPGGFNQDALRALLDANEYV